MATNQALGIDFYSANGGVWKLVQINKPSFAFIGATIGIRSYFDLYGGRAFKEDWQHAKDANLLRGAYHLYIEGVDPQTQANTFLGLVNGAGAGNELPLVLDLEVLNGHPLPQEPGVHAWLQAIESQTHHKPIIYTSSHMWGITVKTASWASDYDLWIARYPSGQPLGYHQPPANSPASPTDWSGKGKTWKFWQYADIGTDLDVFAGTVDDLRNYAAHL